MTGHIENGQVHDSWFQHAGRTPWEDPMGWESIRKKGAMIDHPNTLCFLKVALDRPGRSFVSPPQGMVPWVVPNYGVLQLQLLCALFASIGLDSLGWLPNCIPVFYADLPLGVQSSRVVNLAFELFILAGISVENSLAQGEIG